jgi:hypothetical protein
MPGGTGGYAASEPLPEEASVSAPHEGDSPLDPQSETVHAPHPDDDPPTRGKASVFASGALVTLWIALGVVLVVVALVVAL